MNLKKNYCIRMLPMVLLTSIFFGLIACDGQLQTVIQTVVVEKAVPGPKVIHTVLVQKEVPGPKVIHTVLVQKEVPGPKVIHTVIVKEPVEVQVKNIVQTVIVEKVVEKTIVATPVPGSASHPPQQQRRHGTLVVGIKQPVPTGEFTPSMMPTELNDFLIGSGVHDTLMKAEYTAPPQFPSYGVVGENSLATAWVVASDLSKIKFNIRGDAKFTNDGIYANSDAPPVCFGKKVLTAHDIAYSLNNVMQDDSVNSRGRSLRRFFFSWEAIGERSVVAHVEPGRLEPHWTWFLSDTFHSIAIVRENYADYRDTTLSCGTGPFYIQQWTADSNEIILKPVDDHWSGITPSIEELKFVVIEDDETRIASLVTGGIHLSPITSSNFKEHDVSINVHDLPNTWLQPIGRPLRQNVVFGGNYWAKTAYGDVLESPTDNQAIPDKGELDETIFPRPGLQPDTNHPWIGDPDDIDSMDRARKVRMAMAMAIDRDGINKHQLSGLGKVDYTFTGFGPGDDGFKEEWMIKWDLDAARNLLSEAGVPDGFKFDFWVPQNLFPVDSDMAGMVLGYWTLIGLSPSLDYTEYGDGRDKLYDRSIDIPFAYYSYHITLDEPMGRVFMPTSGERGYTLGMEIPSHIGLHYLASRFEPNPEIRIQNNLMLQEFLSSEMLIIPTVSIPQLWLVRSEIIEWKPRSTLRMHFNSPETIVIGQ